MDADDEALARLRRICAEFTGCGESVLQDRPLFHVQRRRFAIFNGASSPPRRRWADAGRSLHFLSDPSEREPFLHDARFARSPHHGDRGWFAIQLDADTDWQELAELLAAAYEQVVPRHPECS